MTALRIAADRRALGVPKLLHDGNLLPVVRHTNAHNISEERSSKSLVAMIDASGMLLVSSYYVCAHVRTDT